MLRFSSLHSRVLARASSHTDRCDCSFRRSSMRMFVLHALILNARVLADTARYGESILGRRGSTPTTCVMTPSSQTVPYENTVSLRRQRQGSLYLIRSSTGGKRFTVCPCHSLFFPLVLPFFDVFIHGIRLSLFFTRVPFMDMRVSPVHFQ